MVVNGPGSEEKKKDFRKISVVPTLGDLEDEVSIRPNLINEPYLDVDDYLDTQFRLLREDYFSCFRQAINSLRRGENPREVDLYRSYHVMATNSKNFLKIRINRGECLARQSKGVNFMTGSLIMFTNNIFKTFVTGVVKFFDKDHTVLVVNLHQKLPADFTASRYMLAELRIFFEPFCKVLEALQTIKKLPLTRFFIQTNPQNRIPEYVLTRGNTIYTFQNTSFDLVRSSTWPDRKKLGLNPSQFLAFQAALRNEVCLIQGPPGTGKTFLGLKIAQALYENNPNLFPIIVVCYTNHALDNFLEGILKFTSAVVRIGGGSKNPSITDYTLRAIEEKRNWNLKNFGRKVAAIKLLQPAFIGITTTGAAKFREVMAALQAKIFIIEEAAEVLEAHVVASLTEGCQHLILIGDHQQLVPKTASVHFAEDHRLNVSLFERLLLNGLSKYTLQIQHRMRPEICSLVTPSIYETLLNHRSVKVYPPIRGVAKSLFFVTHSDHEEMVNESYCNVHEVAFIVTFAKYLMKMGYKPEDIGVITCYTTQEAYLKELLDPKGITVKTVDGYQGEENKIILLSLVRSNEKKNIGFLSVENRVCVALTRAREGLFIIGNMKNLVYKSVLWKQIFTNLVTQNSYGTAIPLTCPQHPNSTTWASRSDHFSQMMDGCRSPCGMKMLCGHVCCIDCHFGDPNHVCIDAECIKKECKLKEHEMTNLTRHMDYLAVQ